MLTLLTFSKKQKNFKKFFSIGFIFSVLFIFTLYYFILSDIFGFTLFFFFFTFCAVKLDLWFDFFKCRQLQQYNSLMYYFHCSSLILVWTVFSFICLKVFYNFPCDFFIDFLVKSALLNFHIFVNFPVLFCIFSF